MYHYLYTSPTLPAPNDDAIPVGFAPYSPPPPLVFQPTPVQQPVRLQTYCSRVGDSMICN
jgi:hypothetical protein